MDEGDIVVVVTAAVEEVRAVVIRSNDDILF